MAENQTAKERLVQFIKSLGIGQGKFESICGLSNGWVNNVKATIKDDKMQKIILQYPELNTVWLLTGEGSMLKTRMYDSDEQKTVFTSEWYKELQEENKRLRAENEALKNKEAELMEMLKNALAVKAAEIK